MRSRMLPALVAGALTVTLLGQGPASADPRELTGPSLPATASTTAAERASDALARAQALFAEKSPAAARRQAETSGRDATLVLNDLRRAMGDLSPADQQRAQELLARPTAPGGDGIVDYSVAEATPVCGDVICIHYVTTTEDAPPLTDTTPANGIPDQVDRALVNAERVHDTYVDAGYRRPDPDGALGGGSDQVDIYLAEIGEEGLYGYCTSDQPEKFDGTSNYWAYCVIDDDYSGFPNSPQEDQQVTLAHEYFHAVQYAYDATESNWFLEATATWAEDEVFDSVNDNWNYLEYGQMGNPLNPLNTFSGLIHYGNWIFFRFLTEKFRSQTGDMPNLVLEMIQRGSNRTGQPDASAMQAIQKELAQRGTTLAAAYQQFSVANRAPKKFYDEGRNYRAAAPLKTFRLTSSNRSTGKWVGKLLHLSNGPVRYKPGAGTDARDWKLRISVNMPPKNAGPAARVLVFKKSGKIAVSTIRLSPKTTGSKTVSFSSRSVKHVELVLINSSATVNKGKTVFSGRIFRS
jgi:hypothetical protein